MWLDSSRAEYVQDPEDELDSWDIGAIKAPKDLAGRSVIGHPGRLTHGELSYKMSYMGRTPVSVRELQQNLKRVMARVERGEIVEVTRRRRPVARLAPIGPNGSLSPWPDLDARARAVFGDRIVTPGAAQLVIEERGER